MPPSSGHVEIVCAGRLTIDYGVAPSGEPILGRPGGSALYAAVGARVWNDHVGIFARSGTAFSTEWLTRIRQQGLETRGVKVLPETLDQRDLIGPGAHDGAEAVFGAAGLAVPEALVGYRPYLLQKEDRTRFASLAVRPSEAPRTYLAARAAHVAPCELVVQTALPPTLRRSGLSYVTCDPHPRFMTPEFEADVRQVAYGLDAFLPSEAAVRALFKGKPWVDDLWQAAEALAAMGAHSVIIKLGTRGAYVFESATARRWHITAYPARIREATGAGAAFGGGFVSGLLATDDVLEAALRASVSASLVLEGNDPLYALDATPGLAQARLEAMRGNVRSV